MKSTKSKNINQKNRIRNHENNIKVGNNHHKQRVTPPRTKVKKESRPLRLQLPPRMQLNPINQMLKRQILVGKNLLISLISNDPNTNQPNHLQTMMNIHSKEIMSTKLHSMRACINRYNKRNPRTIQ